MRAYTVRQAIQIAERRGAIIEATHPRGFASRSAAARRVPRGGLLVNDAGAFVALDLSPRRDGR